MANYLDIQKEETLKAAVFRDYFDQAKFAYEPNIGNIDFIVTDGGLVKTHYLWAEAKKGEVDEVSMLTQLLLTCRKTYNSGDYLPPPFIGCFDSVKIAFLPFHDILPIFAETDINWNTTPSNYLAKDFIKVRKKVAKLITRNLVVFDFDEDSGEIKRFIKQNFISGMASAKSPITKNNFPHIYNRWVKEVKPTINISNDEWLDFKKNGLLDCDFFRADMMSKDGITISEKLKIILNHDIYQLQEHIKGRLFSSQIDFTDGGAAYRRFWNKYARPPADEYQQYIIDRRDLLVPQNIREVKGSFFTPALWVEKSQEYLEKAFGENWQDEYYVWDCAAGTGNLLAGLVNKYKIWASTVDQPDVDTIHALIDEGLNLLHNHVFKFDFLNDQFENLPEELRKIIDNPKKRKKLIVYINPPYAEDASKGAKNKSGVAINRIHDKYALILQKANHELFAQFLARIYFEIPGCIIAEFSKLKLLTAPNFRHFRTNYFKAKLEKCFVVHADTFDNVDGKFPIGFKIWNTEKKEIFRHICADVFDYNGSLVQKKDFWACDDAYSLNEWIKLFNKPQKTEIGILNYRGTDFGNSNMVFIALESNSSKDRTHLKIGDNNVIEVCIYCTVRHVIDPDWLNDRDQFLYPKDEYKKDKSFQNDCLVFIVFHGQNRISTQFGINHWIPFSEQEVDANENFNSNFMYHFIKDRRFSREAKKVLKSGFELWHYYHAKIKHNKRASIDASFYDIREFFQGRNTNGKMNNKSTDETYNNIIKTLRTNLKVLAQKIAPKVYEYGFLKE